MQTRLKLDIDTFIIVHFALPFLLFLILFTGLEFFRLDLWISRHFFDSAFQQWSFKENGLTEKALSAGGRSFTCLSAAGLQGRLLA